MSYSRWSHSFWYTYWSIPPQAQEDPENRENAIFEICDVARFTAQELREQLEACLLVVKAAVDAKYTVKYTSELEEELKGYIRAFLDDIDKEYPKQQ